MQSATERTDIPAPSKGVERLEAALRHVLKDTFEANLREMVDRSYWYHEDLPCSEAFRLWICDNLEQGADPQWIFDPLRATERRLLCDELGIPRSDIVGKSPRQLASLVMFVSGLPSQDIDGLKAIRDSWSQNRTLVTNDEDRRAAVLCRQRGERFLRELLVFYCGLGYGEYFVQLLRDPGHLKFPQKLSHVVNGLTVEERSERLIEALMDESMGDFGFFSLALRKFSTRVEGGGETHVCGESLLILSQKEYDAFLALASALQAYHHDKPSKQSSRQGDLLTAIESIQEAIEAMMGRRVVPDELFVTEASCASPFGRVFRGLPDTGRIRCLTAENSPALAQRIRFIAAADRDYARCKWRISPWGGSPPG
jgi:hypothetical protein